MRGSRKEHSFSGGLFLCSLPSVNAWDLTRESLATRWHCSPTCELIFTFLVEQLITDAAAIQIGGKG
jgi:hypothetical protein